MRRRDVLRVASLAGLTALSGCTTLGAKAKFEYTPPSPVVGESVVFDGSNSNADKWDWYFDKSPGIANMDAQGKQVTHAFEETGAHTVTLRTSETFSLPGQNVERTTQVVYVEEKETTEGNVQVGGLLSTSTDRISIQLRGVKTRVKIDELTILQFSAANLSAETELSIRLVLKLPSGVNIRGTSFVKSGIGQYASTFELAPGESAGMSIRLEATRTGRFEVEGIADYSFEGENEQTRRGSTIIIVEEE